jgi:MYXO-CTERM domain-containing protein
VGEPTGFRVTVRHGGVIIAEKYVTVGAGGDLQDIKISDGDPEDFVQIGTLGGTNPMILKLVTEDDPTFRLLHMYIDAPVSLANIHAPGPLSLFDPSNGSPIDVSITEMTFSGGAAVIPQLVNNNSFFTCFTRDRAGHFYEMPQANLFDSYGHGVIDIQVPGEAFLDGNAAQYAFSATPGSVSSWSWSRIPNPGPGTTIHNGLASGQPSTGGGYVFELGLAVAFTVVPEPGTAVLALAAAVLAAPRRRRRCSAAG